MSALETTYSTVDQGSSRWSDLVRLGPLMELTNGESDVLIGLIDGPVLVGHPGLAGQEMREVSQLGPASCSRTGSKACVHGTFVAGILSASRDSGAPAIAPRCPLLIRPVFHEHREGPTPSASPAELAKAILETVAARARVINLSVALTGPASASTELTQALDFAGARGTLVVAAAGNQAAVGSSAVTRHPWVIPVAACDTRGMPLQESNCGHAIGFRGLRAPGLGIVSLGPDRHCRLERDQRCCADRHRRHRAALFPVSRCQRGSDQARDHPCRRCAKKDRDAAAIRCVGGVSGSGIAVRSQMEQPIMKKTTKRDQKRTGNAYKVRLPGLIKEDVGLGDAVKAITWAAGIRPCGRCDKRAAILNRWMRFTR